MTPSVHDQLSRALSREPFEPFVIAVADGRRIEIGKPEIAVLNSQAISVMEAPFSVTVVGLPQVVALAPL